MGLGLGYNEDLMVQLALSSDGNHGFAETPDQLSAIFTNELRRTPDGWKLCHVQPNIQFVHDPGGGAARMFPAAAEGASAGT